MVDYYIEKALKEKLDLALERYKKGRDSMWIVDGGEGDGKSTATIGWANYIAEKMDIPLTVDNIFFDAEDMLKYAATHTGQIIIWDEACTAGMATQWQSGLQQKLIKILMMARKKKHFWFFVIPKFHKLNEYIVDRAIGLIHCYSPDLVKQGHFVYFKKESKDMLYQIHKEKKHKSYKQHWSIRGVFVKKGFVIDEKLYDIKKDKAIMDVFNDKKVKSNRDKEELNRIKGCAYILKKRYKIPNKEMAEVYNVHENTIPTWNPLRNAETKVNMPGQL